MLIILYTHLAKLTCRTEYPVPSNLTRILDFTFVVYHVHIYCKITCSKVYKGQKGYGKHAWERGVAREILQVFCHGLSLCRGQTLPVCWLIRQCNIDCGHFSCWPRCNIVSWQWDNMSFDNISTIPDKKAETFMFTKDERVNILQ